MTFQRKIKMNYVNKTKYAHIIEYIQAAGKTLVYINIALVAPI